MNIIQALRERYRRRSWEELRCVRPAPTTPALSSDTQGRLHALGAAFAVSESRRKWLIFTRYDRVTATQRPTPATLFIDWSEMQRREVR